MKITEYVETDSTEYVDANLAKTGDWIAKDIADALSDRCGNCWGTWEIHVPWENWGHWILCRACN